MGETFWQKETLLYYTMTLLQVPKNPVLPILIYIWQNKFPLTVSAQASAYMVVVVCLPDGFAAHNNVV